MKGSIKWEILQQGGNWIFLELFSAGRMAYLLRFLNGPCEDPTWEASHYFTLLYFLIYFFSSV